MIRASNPKSSPLRCFVGDGGGVGANIGNGVIGGDCAGAEEPLPVMPLEEGAGVAWPPDVAIGYDCEGGR